MCRAAGGMPVDVDSELSILKAIAEARELSPDIIMLNIEQAGSNATDIVKALKTAAAGARVVGYGHAWTESYHTELSGAGMDDILILPANARQVRKILEVDSNGVSLEKRNTLRVDDAAEMAGFFSNMVRGRFMNVCRELAAAIPQGAEHLRRTAELLLADFLKARLVVVERTATEADGASADGNGADENVELTGADGRNFGVLRVWVDHVPIDKQTLGDIADYLVVLFELVERDRDLKSLATVDELTGVYNRRYLESYMRQLLARAESENIKIAMLVFDIDNFKYYNDTYGHIAGDHILCQATDLVRQCCRKHDVVARLGGDEFAVLFWDAPELGREVKPEHVENDAEMPGHEEMVIRISNNFRKLVSESECASRYRSHVSKLTISGGIASYPKDGDTVKQLLAAADAALLKSKEAGKNQIKKA